jgi:hypothetical protein
MPVENGTPRELVVSREPKGPVRGGSPGSVGDNALKDALIIVGVSWAILFFLYFTLPSNG